MCREKSPICVGKRALYVKGKEPYMCREKSPICVGKRPCKCREKSPCM